MDSTANITASSTPPLTTPTEMPLVISELHLIIISVVLSAVVVVLLFVLGFVIRMRRKRGENISGRRKLGKNLSSAAQSVLRDEEADPDETAIYQPPELIHHIASYLAEQQIKPQFTQVTLRRPANLEPDIGFKDCENGNITSNQTNSSPSLSGSKAPTLKSRNVAFALPLRKDDEKTSLSDLADLASDESEIDLNTVIKKRASNLFREGTKLYHHYVNATRHDYEVPRDRIATKEVLGKGHFGSVYYGKLLDQDRETVERVAIKTMRKSAADTDKNEFIYEFEIMKLINTLRHPNLIGMIGAITKSEPYMILLELMPNGNLRQFLRDSRSSHEYYNLHGNSRALTEQQLLQFSLDIARGMQGVAELQLLHRDLAARNILLDKDFNCKIADFGFAKDVLNTPEYKCKSVFKRPRPTRWLPPESLLYYKHSIQSDVWSYGIVLWEIVTLGNLPYPFIKDSAKVVAALSKGLRMKQPKYCSRDMFKVMKVCWEEKPEDRPTFTELVDMMEQLIAKAEIREVLRDEDDDYIHELPDHSTEIFTNFIENETLD